MAEHIFTDYSDATQALRIKDLKQSLYDDGEVIMDKVLVCLHGDEHKKRRKLENKIFTRDVFQKYENIIFPKTINETLEPYKASGKMDLVDFGFRVLLNLTADFSGIDRPNKSKDETETLLRLLKIFASGATLHHSTRDHEEVKSEVREALKEFDENFLTPSIERRRIIINQESKEDLPNDILTVLLINEDQLNMPYDVLKREIAFYLLAGAQTSIHSLVHVFHEIHSWLKINPARKDDIINNPIFVQKCFLESTRLHPSSPVALRKSVCPVQLPGDKKANTGDDVIIDLYNSNRDKKVFGKDADIFNPDRETPNGQNLYGLSFGLGMHSCIGRNLAAGVNSKPDTDPTNHHYGTVTMIMRKLIACSALPDNNDQPKMDEKTKRPNWGYYPITFNVEEDLK
jgi:cytochrome P450